jgi:transcriptional regulator with GAF, ATPase, and Fis domain
MNVSLERLRKKRLESETRINELVRLYDISTGINAAISLDTLLKIVAKEATLLVERPWASIVLFNQKQEVTHSVFVGLNQNREVKLDRRMRRGGLNEWIWTHNSPIVVEDTQRDRRANCSACCSTSAFALSSASRSRRVSRWSAPSTPGTSLPSRSATDTCAS